MRSLLSLDRDWGTFWFSGTGHETARYPARKQPSIVTKPDPFFRLDHRSRAGSTEKLITLRVECRSAISSSAEIALSVASPSF